MVLRSPATTTNASNGSTSDSSRVPSGNLNSKLNSTTGSSASDDGSGGTTGVTTTGRGTAGRSTTRGSHSHPDRSGSKTRDTTGATKKGATTTTTTTPPPHSAVVATVQPFTNSADDPAATSNLQELVPGLDPTAPGPSVVAVPGAPTVIKATSGHGSSRVTWSAPSNQGTSPITGYDVYEGTVSGGEYAVPVNGPTPITAASYLVSNLTVGTTYYFTVKAINAVGFSASSNEVSACLLYTSRCV